MINENRVLNETNSLLHKENLIKRFFILIADFKFSNNEEYPIYALFV